MKELSLEEATKGLVILDTQWYRYYVDQMEQRKFHDWFWVALELKKMYDAAEINKKNWTSEDTTKAYIESYV
jgi:hypothetical protein